MHTDKSSFFQVAWDVGARQINDCENLFAEKIGESEELTLDLLIAEAKPQAPITTVDKESVLGNIMIGARPIEVDNTCRLFRLIFGRNDMISYTVLNESYGRYPEPPEEFTGKLFRIFTSSLLLDFTKSTTNASEFWPGPLQHYEVACLNHIVDVICTAPPQISLFLPDSTPEKRLALMGGSQPQLEPIVRRRSEHAE